MENKDLVRLKYMLGNPPKIKSLIINDLNLCVQITYKHDIFKEKCRRFQYEE